MDWWLYYWRQFLAWCWSGLTGREIESGEQRAEDRADKITVEKD